MGEIFEQNYEAIMAGQYNKELLSDAATKDLCDSLKKLLKDNVYYCPEIIKTKIEASVILEELLSAFVMASFNAQKNGKQDDRDSLIYNMLSKNYCAVCNRAINAFKAETGKNSALTPDERGKRERAFFAYSKLVLARDQLSGMTDTFATISYQIIRALSI